MPADRLTRTAPAPAQGIVHLGFCFFFRSHGAIYTEEAIAASGGAWGITGVSLQSTRMRDALGPVLVQRIREEAEAAGGEKNSVNLAFS